MSLAKQGLLPPGVNPQALMQSFMQLQMQQNLQFNAIFDPEKKNNPQSIENSKQMQLLTQNLMTKAPLAVGSATNAAAALAYQQQMNQQYVMHMMAKTGQPMN